MSCSSTDLNTLKSLFLVDENNNIDPDGVAEMCWGYARYVLDSSKSGNCRECIDFGSLDSPETLRNILLSFGISHSCADMVTRVAGKICVEAMKRAMAER